MAKAVIIGGGIIGLCSAFYLQKAGYQVTILDKGDLTDNCSSGNAGMIVPSHFVPLAAPGMLQRGIRWMFDSKSPFYVRPSFNPQLLSWGIKFIKNATTAHLGRSAVPLRDLSLLSSKLYDDINDQAIFDFGLKKRGILMFYKTKEAAAEEAELFHKASELGLDMDILTPNECRALQPDLKLDVLGAVHYRCDGHLNPNELVPLLTAYLRKAGVAILTNTEVTGFEINNGKITSVIASSEKFTADEFIIAGGAWSPAVAKLAGLKISLLPGKGYSFMVKNTQNMTIPALLAEARVAATPMDEMIRCGGTMEIDRINSRLNINRIRGIVDAIPQYFPDFKPQMPQLKDIWYGFRPCSPDGLPYIGRSLKYNNLVVATGHGMMGLSLAPATGLLVSQVITDADTAIDIRPFSPDRF